VYPQQAAQPEPDEPVPSGSVQAAR